MAQTEPPMKRPAPVPLRRPRPRLQDVHCSRMTFEKGERLLVRCYAKLSPDQERQLRRTVEKWAGDGVPVLIINGLEMDVTKERLPLVTG